MQKISFFYTVVISLLFCGCSVVTGSYHYTRGTECLGNGDYEEASCHLKQSVENDPNFAGSQTNLALAYLALGEDKKAWPHLRKACLLAPKDYGCAINLRNYWNKHKACAGLQQGTSKDVILSYFGAPDLILPQGSNRTCLVYGLIFVYLLDDRFEKDESKCP